MWPFRRKSRPGLGSRGEDLAKRFLARRGLKILARNYRCPAGEVDLIVLDSCTGSASQLGTIVFVEVKTRSSDRHTAPSSAVNSYKRKKLRSAASHYIGNHSAEGYNIRFDVISIVCEDGQPPRLEHIPEAF